MVIEQTSKRWKGLQLVFALMAVAGLAIVPTGSGGAAIGGIGLLGFIVARIGAWWHHG